MQRKNPKHRQENILDFDHPLRGLWIGEVGLNQYPVLQLPLYPAKEWI